VKFIGEAGLPDNQETSDPVAYRSRVRIERVKGPIRRAHVPAHDGPVMLGVHSEVAEHYGVDNSVVDPYTTTLDYVVMATAG
jgi:hypothetical protein